MANTDHSPTGGLSPAVIASVVLVGVLVLGGTWVRAGLLGAGAWPIEWLDVEGQLRRVSAEQVRSAVRVHTERGFFSADLNDVRVAVEALPWVASAQVRRQWPDGIVVRIGEHHPVARWNSAAMISREASLFNVAGATEIQGLPWLQGPEGRRDEVLQTWVDMHAVLAPVGMDIDRLKLDDRGAWEVVLSNGTVLMLGRQHTMERLRRYVGVSEALRREHDRPPVVVDLRYTNGLAVRWPENTVPDEEEHG